MIKTSEILDLSRRYWPGVGLLVGSAVPVIVPTQPEAVYSATVNASRTKYTTHLPSTFADKWLRP